MARLRGKKDDPHHPLVEDDLQEMYAILEKESRAGVGSWGQCFSDQASGISRTLYRTLLGFGLQFAQQWTGINYFSMSLLRCSPLRLYSAHLLLACLL